MSKDNDKQVSKTDIYNLNKISDLLNILSNNRNGLVGLLKDIEEFRENINVLLPKSTDFRNRRVTEERMKTLSSVVSNEVSIRKAIEDSLKSEVSIRERAFKENDLEDGSELIELTEAIKLLSKTQKNSKKNLENIIGKNNETEESK